jgi:hypothetical protein
VVDVSATLRVVIDATARINKILGIRTRITSQET